VEEEVGVGEAREEELGQERQSRRWGGSLGQARRRGNHDSLNELGDGATSVVAWQPRVSSAAGWLPWASSTVGWRPQASSAAGRSRRWRQWA
jgi:hypothetical protein